MEFIYQNTKIRAVLSGILTMFVSISLAVLGDWSKDQKCFIIKIIIFFFLSFLDIIHLVLCAAQDSKENKLIKELSKKKIENLEIKKESLHEKFIKYYGGDDYE